MNSVTTELDRLLCGYWNGTLSEGEHAALEARLLGDPRAREALMDWSLHATQAAESKDIQGAVSPATHIQPRTPFQLDRRKLLAGFGAGTAFGLLSGAVFVKWWTNNRAPAVASNVPVQLLWSQGTVVLKDASGVVINTTEPLPLGGTIETVGTQSSAMLGFGRGSTVCLSAETKLARSEQGEVLTLEQGGIAADLYPAANGNESLTVASSQLNIVMSGRAEVCLSQSSGATDLAVQQGLAMVVTGDQPQPVSVYTGELVSVSKTQETTIQPVPIIPDRLAMDFARPLPQGWTVGESVTRHGRGCVTTKLWYDPYHKAKLHEIRSQHAYTRGLVRIYPDSVIEVDYHAERAGQVQFVICVRSIPSTRRTSGNLDWIGQVQECTDRRWKTLKLRGDEFLNHKQPPSVGPPWVGFLLIFNTADVDLGFHVAQLRVSRPGAPKG
jgi:ferric-dicitrate binding protein FerR (iron transport regulator)